MWQILKSRSTTLLPVLVAEAFAVWSVFNSTSRALKLLLAFLAVWLAIRHQESLGRRIGWADLWWSWPLVFLTIVGVAFFVLTAAHVLGFF
jgi:hypothetical protein